MNKNVEYLRHPKYSHLLCGRDGSIYSLKSKKLLSKRAPIGRYVVIGVGNKISKYAHRLIADCFIVNTQNLLCINHINGIKTDNRVCNLEYVTYSENAFHAFSTGLIPKKYRDTKKAKLKIEDVLNIRELYLKKIMNQRELANKYDVKILTINLIVNRKTWRYI